MPLSIRSYNRILGANGTRESGKYDVYAYTQATPTCQSFLLALVIEAYVEV